MTKYYVAARFRCVVVEARDECEARDLGRDAIEALIN